MADFSFDSLWEAVKNGTDDLVKVGKPMIEKSLEQWGHDVLTDQMKKTDKELNAAVKEIAAKDNPPGSFGAALSATIQGTIFQTYGLWIIFGIAALIILGFMLRGKK